VFPSAGNSATPIEMEKQSFHRTMRQAVFNFVYLELRFGPQKRSNA
jgi:hypothetical protein